MVENALHSLSSVSPEGLFHGVGLFCSAGFGRGERGGDEGLREDAAAPDVSWVGVIFPSQLTNSSQ